MCDTLVHVFPDRVLFAKNSDREADEPQQLDWQPRLQHRPGESVQCTWLAIPQVAETYAVLLSRPIWMWGAEMGSNEHGVTIGNEAVFTRHAVPQIGLTGMDLLRLALERAKTAAEAVEVITSLHERHGQGGRCGYEALGFRYYSSFLVADGSGAFVVETAGHEFAVERVAGARSISNGLTIPSFAKSHSDFLKTRISECRRRRARTEMSAAAVSDLAGLARALRDHGDAEWPRYDWLNGCMAAPCMHAGGLAAASQTTASWIAELRPGPAARTCRHFVTATAAPCLSLFKPVRVETAAEVGAVPGTSPDESLWWTHERLHRLTMRDPERLAALFEAERDEMESRYLGGEVQEWAAWEESRQAELRWLHAVKQAALSIPGGKPIDVRPWWTRRYWRQRRAV